MFDLQVAAVVEGLAGRGKRPARAAISREEIEKKRQTGKPQVTFSNNCRCHTLQHSAVQNNQCIIARYVGSNSKGSPMLLP